MQREEYLVKQCKRQKGKAQKEVYEVYSPFLRGICLRYTVDASEAEDILQEGFIKIFTKIESFRWNGTGSFKFWMQRVIVNTAINHYREQKKSIVQTGIDENTNCDTSDDEQEVAVDSFEFIRQSDLTKEELLECLNAVPDDFRIVFNLYVIEGMRHKEISTSLAIEERTSRSRLSRARKILQDEIKQLCIQKMKLEVHR